MFVDRMAESSAGPEPVEGTRGPLDGRRRTPDRERKQKPNTYGCRRQRPKARGWINRASRAIGSSPATIVPVWP